MLRSNDILFEDALCEQGRNFCNKIWNAFRLIKGWTNGKGSIPVPPEAHLAVQWFDQRLDAAAVEVADLFSKYRFRRELKASYPYAHRRHHTFRSAPMERESYRAI